MSLYLVATALHQSGVKITPLNILVVGFSCREVLAMYQPQSPLSDSSVLLPT